MIEPAKIRVHCAYTTENSMPRVNLTADLIRRFSCPPDKPQAFLRDSGAPGLGVRATQGAKVFIFQSKLADGRTVRTTIGDVRTYGIDDARRETRRLQIMVDQGLDPREERRALIEASASKREQVRLEQTPALQAWADYIEARRHHWGETYIQQHEDAAKAGGEPRTRGAAGVTEPGILRGLLAQPLAHIDAAAVQHWLKSEAARRPTRARSAFAILRAFFNWCADHPRYGALTKAGACTARPVRQELPKKNARKDALRREQLPAWFAAVRNVRSPVAAAYFQALLLTGARPGELASLKWDDVDFQWRSLTIRDKVEGERTIPMTPYVAALLHKLKTINEAPPTVRQLRAQAKAIADTSAPAPSCKPSAWVFASSSSATGRRANPVLTHKRACAAAGLDDITLHGLRRSFGSLAEWTETPAGVVAQIMGHKPSATAEKHYRVRPLDLLRMWHTKLEAWILEQAGVEQPAEAQAVPALRVVESA